MEAAAGALEASGCGPGCENGDGTYIEALPRGRTLLPNEGYDEGSNVVGRTGTGPVGRIGRPRPMGSVLASGVADIMSSSMERADDLMRELDDGGGTRPRCERVSTRLVEDSAPTDSAWYRRDAPPRYGDGCVFG